MKKFIALAGVAGALLTAVPVAAQADSYHHTEVNGPNGGHYERDVHRNYNDHHVEVHHDVVVRRDFDYWRPALVRAHYYAFGRPIFYDHYYRVPCRDYYGRAVFLTINAYTGAIISVGF